MLQFESEIVGKHAQFGILRKKLKNYGFYLGGYWENNRGFFDATLSKQNGETIYLRLPFIVTSGILDSDNAHIQFQTPYVIKQVGHFNFDESFLHHPYVEDGELQDKHKWVQAGELVVGKVLQYIN